ncbi:hypothetical protein Sjap_020618 [Stephania japonica]|uniref:Uncharacterized protein n=1 Tax=Stephania japonica TaxID=461633 RepID=A0AAP0I0U0_9MAGN
MDAHKVSNVIIGLQGTQGNGLCKVHCYIPINVDPKFSNKKCGFTSMQPRSSLSS